MDSKEWIRNGRQMEFPLRAPVFMADAKGDL